MRHVLIHVLINAIFSNMLTAVVFAADGDDASFSTFLYNSDQACHQTYSQCHNRYIRHAYINNELKTEF